MPEITHVIVYCIAGKYDWEINFGGLVVGIEWPN